MRQSRQPVNIELFDGKAVNIVAWGQLDAATFTWTDLFFPPVLTAFVWVLGTRRAKALSKGAEMGVFGRRLRFYVCMFALGYGYITVVGGALFKRGSGPTGVHVVLGACFLWAALVVAIALLRGRKCAQAPTSGDLSVRLIPTSARATLETSPQTNSRKTSPISTVEPDS